DPLDDEQCAGGQGDRRVHGEHGADRRVGRQEPDHGDGPEPGHRLRERRENREEGVRRGTDGEGGRKGADGPVRRGSGPNPRPGGAGRPGDSRLTDTTSSAETGGWPIGNPPVRWLESNYSSQIGNRRGTRGKSRLGRRTYATSHRSRS